MKASNVKPDVSTSGISHVAFVDLWEAWIELSPNEHFSREELEAEIEILDRLTPYAAAVELIDRIRFQKTGETPIVSGISHTSFQPLWAAWLGLLPNRPSPNYLADDLIELSQIHPDQVVNILRDRILSIKESKRSDAENVEPKKQDDKWLESSDSVPRVYRMADEPNALSETLAPGVEQIPFEAIEAIGAIFEEGGLKYGVDNWKKGIDDVGYQTERCRHAIRHLMLWANGDRTEPHLAKVAWFCVTQIWHEKHAVGHTDGT